MKLLQVGLVPAFLVLALHGAVPSRVADVPADGRGGDRGKAGRLTRGGDEEERLRRRRPVFASTARRDVGQAATVVIRFGGISDPAGGAARFTADAGSHARRCR